MKHRKKPDPYEAPARKAAMEILGKRGQLSPQVEDLRKKILYLSPYSGWIPKGVKNRIVNITDFDGEVVGELEIGSDGFVQLIVNIPGKDVTVLKVEFYPGRDHAKVIVQ